MISKEYIEQLDWSSAIAAATQELENKPPLVNTTQGQQINAAESFLYRGIARCFTPDKDKKYKEAIDDLSNAISLEDNKALYNFTLSSDFKDKSYYYRAYAFYLEGNYEKAIGDCGNINKKEYAACKQELLGKIFTVLNNYEKAVDAFRNAMSCYTNSENTLIPSGLMDLYREACRKMNSQG